jgi:hypothetical protein
MCSLKSNVFSLHRRMARVRDQELLGPGSVDTHTPRGSSPRGGKSGDADFVVHSPRMPLTVRYT